MPSSAWGTTSNLRARAGGGSRGTSRVVAGGTSSLTGPSGALRRKELTYAALRQRQHLVHLAARERLAFGGALHFDDAAAAGHHDVHVGVARRILGIVQIEHRHALDTCPPTPRRRIAHRRARGTIAAPAASPTASCSGDEGAGDARGARAAVGLDHVAVELHRALAERFRSTTARSARPIRRWISCVRPDCLPRAASRSHARVGRARQHAVFGGEPALPCLSGTAARVLDAGGADHLVSPTRRAPSLPHAGCSRG